jgi:hypothetical protein
MIKARKAFFIVSRCLNLLTLWKKVKKLLNCSGLYWEARGTITIISLNIGK